MSKETTPETPTNYLLAKSDTLEDSLATIDHSPTRREQIQKELSYIAFELTMRGSEAA